MCRKMTAGKSFKFQVTIPMAKKLSTYDEDPGRTAVRQWFATATKEPNSAYFLVREVVSATSVHYKMGNDFGGAVAVDASARKYLESKVSAKGDVGNGFELDQTFPKPLNVCLLPEQIVVARANLDGKPPSEADIELRPDPKYFVFSTEGQP